MDENGFKTKVFGGFNKKQVLKYLDDIHADFNSRAADMQSEINRLNADCEKLSASVKASYDKNTELESEIKKLLCKNEETQNCLDLEKQEKDAALSKAADYKEQLKRAAFQVESMRRKCEKYDSIHQNINDLISEAKGMSEKIISDAKLKADRLVKTADLKADTILRAAEARAEKMNESTERISAEFSENITGVKTDIDAIKSGLADMTRQVESKLREIEITLANAQRSGADLVSDRDGFCKSAGKPVGEISADDIIDNAQKRARLNEAENSAAEGLTEKKFF